MAIKMNENRRLLKCSAEAQQATTELKPQNKPSPKRSGKQHHPATRSIGRPEMLVGSTYQESKHGFRTRHFIRHHCGIDAQWRRRQHQQRRPLIFINSENMGTFNGFWHLPGLPQPYSARGRIIPSTGGRNAHGNVIRPKGGYFKERWAYHFLSLVAEMTSSKTTEEKSAWSSTKAPERTWNVQEKRDQYDRSKAFQPVGTGDAWPISAGANLVK